METRDPKALSPLFHYSSYYLCSNWWGFVLKDVGSQGPVRFIHRSFTWHSAGHTLGAQSTGVEQNVYRRILHFGIFPKIRERKKMTFYFSRYRWVESAGGPQWMSLGNILPICVSHWHLDMIAALAVGTPLGDWFFLTSSPSLRDGEAVFLSFSVTWTFLAP